MREFWPETHRRMVAVQEDGRTLLAVDLYRRLGPGEELPGEPAGSLAIGPVRLSYRDVTNVLGNAIDGLLYAEIVVLETPGRRELIEARLVLSRGELSLGEASSVYESIVKLFENRDPKAEPVEAPQPVVRVYRSRGL